MPFMNYGNYFAYGPPIARKFTCSSCGYVFIDKIVGRAVCIYCASCGKKTMELTEEKDIDWQSISVPVEEFF